MFKSGGVLGTVGSKIAHTSTLPVLGNKDLKLLQDLITAEKNVLTSLTKLSVDYAKASEALKAWGLGEGDDLGDVLSQTCTLLLHISTAYAQYATHHHPLRTSLKQIRTREEQLDATKRQRRSVISKAEAAEKRLAKMGPENKNLTQQSDLLTKLREDIRALDTEILTEEARLGDFKRTVTSDCLGLKLGGLLECSEKGKVVGEIGKVMIDEIPLETTFPGQSRIPYGGYERTALLVSEAAKEIGEITFNQANVMNIPISRSARLSTSSDQTAPLPPSSIPYLYPSDSPSLPFPRTASGMSASEFLLPPGASAPTSEFGEQSRTRIGDNTSRTRLSDVPSVSSAQYSTYPSDRRAMSGHQRDASFSSSVADALNQNPEFNPSTTESLSFSTAPTSIAVSRARSESPPRRFQAPPSYSTGTIPSTNPNPWDNPESPREEEEPTPTDSFPRPPPGPPPKSDSMRPQPQFPTPKRYASADGGGADVAANAAAARELQREMDALGFNAATSSPTSTISSPPPSIEPPPPGTRTISAAAFRRPQPRTPSTTSEPVLSTDSATGNTAPLQPRKKGLPSSPYPIRLDGATSPSGSFYTSKEESERKLSAYSSQVRTSPNRSPTLSTPPEEDRDGEGVEGGGQYGSWNNASSREGAGVGGYGSPTTAGFVDRGCLGNVRVVNPEEESGSGGTGGYNSGNFATNLEE